MPAETHIRLCSWLDTNQRSREQMCRAVLALDQHCADVRPRHPSGGPDGGRDIEAVLDGQRVVFGAVGFANGANDSAEQKKTLKKKFSKDLASALKANPDLKAFVFMTNLALPMGEQSQMKAQALKRGIEHCDIVDRERLRIELDSPKGFFIRFQYLEIPLSEAEQASFLSEYGDRIQDVVSTGFQKIERTLNRIVFLQEASDTLDGIGVMFVLKKTYPAGEILHFRAFIHVMLRAIKLDIATIFFGSADRAYRFSPDGQADHNNEPSGIGSGIGGGRWEWQLSTQKLTTATRTNADDISTKNTGRKVERSHQWTQVGSSNSIGVDPVSKIFADYSHDDVLIRFRPRLQLRDLDDCSLMPVLNRSLAEKLHSFQVYANGYKLADIGAHDFYIDESEYDSGIDQYFSSEELGDPWVRIRPKGYSTFQIRFTSTTPKRMYGHNETPDTPTPSEGQR